jgi:hypothetical protein
VVFHGTQNLWHWNPPVKQIQSLYFSRCISEIKWKISRNKSTDMILRSYKIYLFVHISLFSFSLSTNKMLFYFILFECKRWVESRSFNGSGRFILFFYYFLFDLNPTRLNFGQKILTHTWPDQVTGRPDPCKIINYFYIILSN